MAEPVELFRYMRYLRLRWRWIAGSSAVALAIACGVTLLLPKQYTATARVLIEPPAGTDLRSAMAISPIYLESLKTYEHFAASDSLFQKALDRFQLHYPQSIEAVKKRVLKVGLVRNTRILEISATMAEARAAQAMAQFVAESTVELTRSVMNDGDRDLVGGLEVQQRAAQARVQVADDAWARALGSEPVNQLQAEMESNAELRSTIQKEVASAELMIAESAERKQQASAGESVEIQRETSGARARLAEMNRQIQQIERGQSERERVLAGRLAHRDTLEAERKARQSELAASETRLRDARADSGYRGERMKIIDPGIVPQQPSSPNLILNLMAAMLVGLILPVIYLAIEMNYQEDRITVRRTALPAYLTRDE